MKIIVDELPSKPEDCLFTKFCVNERCIPNCLFRSRPHWADFENSFSPRPNKMNCVLADGKDCPFLTTKN